MPSTIENFLHIATDPLARQLEQRCIDNLGDHGDMISVDGVTGSKVSLISYQSSQSCCSMSCGMSDAREPFTRRAATKPLPAWYLGMENARRDSSKPRSSPLQNPC